MEILATVRVLVKDYGSTKTAACKTVSDWLHQEAGHWSTELVAPAVRKRVTVAWSTARPFTKGRK